MVSVRAQHLGARAPDAGGEVQHVALFRQLDRTLCEPYRLGGPPVVGCQACPGGETQDGFAAEVGRHGDVAAVVEAALGVVPAALVAIQEGELVGRLHRPRVGRVVSEVAVPLPHCGQVLLGACTVAEKLARLYWGDPRPRLALPAQEDVLTAPGVGAGFLEATCHCE